MCISEREGGGSPSEAREETEPAGKKRGNRPRGTRSAAPGSKSAEDTPPSFTPPGCGSALETGAAGRRQVDYTSQQASRCGAYCSRQPLRVGLFPLCRRLGRNYSSQEASREVAWKWAAWKSLGPRELAVSPASGAGPDAAVVGPPERAAGIPRYVVPGAGAASRQGGGASRSVRTRRVSAGGRPSAGTGCGGGGAGTRALPTRSDSCSHGSTFPTWKPARFRGKPGVESGSCGFAFRLRCSGSRKLGSPRRISVSPGVRRRRGECPSFLLGIPWRFFFFFMRTGE